MKILDDIRPALAFLDNLQAGVTLLDGQLDLVWSNRYFQDRLTRLPGLCGMHCFAGEIANERRCEDCIPPLVQRSGRAMENLRAAEGADGVLSYYRVIVSPFGPEEELLCTLIVPLPSEEMDEVDSWRERFLLSAIRNSNDGVFAFDRTNTIRFWNRGAEHIFGRSIADAVGRPSQEVLFGGEPTTVEEMFRPRDPMVTLYNHELRVGTPDRGEIWIEASRTPLLDGSGHPNGCGFVVRDITERKLAEEKMAFTERMTAVGNMAAALAHEIGTPLGVISNNAEFLMLDLGEDDERREELDAIVRETDRIGGLVSELLRFSRPDVPEMEPLRVSDILDRVRRLIHHASEKQHTTIETQIEETTPLILGDTDQLEQVVLNLSMNALQSLGSKGTLRMIARRREAVGLDGRTRDGVEVEIQDTGPGLRPDVLSKVFDPFFTTKPNGTGLGLSVCKSLVEKHNGAISAHNLPEGGAAIRVWLPAN